MGAQICRHRSEETGGWCHVPQLMRATCDTNACSRCLPACSIRHRSLDCGTDGRDRRVQCTAQSPVVIALDVTPSMDHWPDMLWCKLPGFCEELQKYLPDPNIAFAAVGDVGGFNGPLQITDFAEGAALDEQIQKLALAGGDGLCGCTEAYCLAAYFCVHRMDFPDALHKPFLFLSADERPYAVVGGEPDGSNVARFLGGEAQAAISTAQVFQQLCHKYEVLVLHQTPPHKFWVKQSGLTAEELGDEIRSDWAALVGAERVLPIVDCKVVADVMLGAVALVRGVRSLDTFNLDMDMRGVAPQRQNKVCKALSALAEAVQVPLKER